ncbi:MAG: GNAT family protein [Anaerolineae bacterium]|nr:GNAT family protein [Anaerolineae bacterium]
MNPLLLDLPTEFTSKRLHLRPYRPGEGAMYFRMLRENWDHLYEFMPPSRLALQSEQDAEEVIRRLQADWHLRQLFIFGVWQRDSGAYVGEAYLANPDWEVPCLELGYFMVKAATGQGFATEAARATIRFAFEHLHVSRVELQCAADNQASIRAAERCGFKYEGRLRQRPHKKDGSLVDRLWYGLLRSEWQQSLAGRSAK